MMGPVDVIAALASGAASLAMGLRSGMLKRDILSKPTAPRPVTLAIMVSAAALGGASFHIWHGAHANMREAICYAALALTSWVMLANLWMQKRGTSPTPPRAT